MVLRYPITLSFFALVLSATFAATSFAQTPTASSTASTANKSETTPVRSAFDGYAAYSDEPVGNWQAANDNVARIGGWREYARQAQSDDGTPPRPAAPEKKPSVKPNVKAAP